MLEEEAYQTLWSLLDSIPSLEDPDVTIRREIVDFNAKVKTEAHARLVDRNHRIIDASVYGFNHRDRLEMTRLLATPERALGARRIDEIFSEHFFSTNFWQMWRTTFAFQNWHSAAELKRYMQRFIQEFPQMHTLAGVRRTKYNQYDSIARPIQRWLAERGVDVRFGARVIDVDFDQSDPDDRRVTRLHLQTEDGETTIALARDDVAMLTLGSIAADASFRRQRRRARTDPRSARRRLGAVGRDREQSRGFRSPARVLQRRREQVGILHADHARPRAARPHHRVLRQRRREPAR